MNWDLLINTVMAAAIVGGVMLERHSAKKDQEKFLSEHAFADGQTLQRVAFLEERVESLEAKVESVQGSHSDLRVSMEGIKGTVSELSKKMDEIVALLRMRRQGDHGI